MTDSRPFAAALTILALVFAACSSERNTATAPMATEATTNPATEPVARCYATMADGPGQTGVLLLGGFDNSGPPGAFLSDLWAFSQYDGWTSVSEALDAGPGDVEAATPLIDSIRFDGLS